MKLVLIFIGVCLASILSCAFGAREYDCIQLANEAQAAFNKIPQSRYGRVWNARKCFLGWVQNNMDLVASSLQKLSKQHKTLIGMYKNLAEAYFRQWAQACFITHQAQNPEDIEWITKNFAFDVCKNS